MKEERVRETIQRLFPDDDRVQDFFVYAITQKSKVRCVCKCQMRNIPDFLNAGKDYGYGRIALPDVENPDHVLIKCKDREFKITAQKFDDFLYTINIASFGRYLFWEYNELDSEDLLVVEIVDTKAAVQELLEEFKRLPKDYQKYVLGEMIKED